MDRALPMSSNKQPVGPIGRLWSRGAALVTAVLFSTCGVAQITSDAQSCEDLESYRYIRSAHPPPHEHLRQDNITDEEVREVQRAALDVYPDSIVNISGVTDGCDCEDGGGCTAQVWLALYRDNKIRSLELSKIGGHWAIGAVQRWTLEFDQLQARNPGYGSRANQMAWQEERQRLLDSFPSCPTPKADWMTLRANGSFSTCLDTSSIRTDGFVRTARLKYTLPRVVSVRPPLASIRQAMQLKYTIDLIAFDCKDRREQRRESDSYHEDGTVTKSPSVDSVLWDPIRPSTPMEADWELVCGWK
jgi:hypothetical protein